MNLYRGLVIVVLFAGCSLGLGQDAVPETSARPEITNATPTKDSTAPTLGSFSSSKDVSSKLLVASATAPGSVSGSEVALVSYMEPSIQPIPKAPEPNKISPRDKKIWYSLAAVEHSAAAFDAWSTRDAIGRGAQELNPTLKPFANSGAIYAATQVLPMGMDYLGHRFLKSNNRVLRKLWWVPQTASTVVSLTAGFHNVAYSPAR